MNKKETAFRKEVLNYYKKNKRHFPWRETTDPYRITVSEIMLQQTQTHRVAPKYDLFIKAFPSWQELARAPFKDVLAAWKGLGYNRRALALHRIARIVMDEYQGQLPEDPQALIELPAIGPNTAGSIRAFAFNRPAIFIETNIRTAFIHHFFKRKKSIDDTAILKLVKATIDRKNPREWYYALMDYGVMLKKMHKNPSRKSVHYKKQSPFKGSARELRAQILHQIVLKPSTLAQIAKSLKRERKEVERHTNDLAKEGFVALESGMYRVKE